MKNVSGEGGNLRIERESEALIRLGMLLRRERSQRGSNEVQDILGQEISTWEKVRLIRSLDERERRASAGRASRASNHPHRYFGTVKARKSRTATREAARRPPRVKATFYREGYFAFLIRHLRRIRTFGQSTRTLASVFFPPSVRISEQVPGFYAGYVQPVAGDIYVTLSQLMSNAWVHLSKRQYNLLVLVLDLCDAIQRSPITPAHLHETKAVDHLKTVEQNLLAIRYNEDSVSLILDAISTLRSRNRRIIAGLETLYEMVKGLISRDGNAPSLIDTILALNMLRYRRHITESELTLSGLGQIVETQVFDCPAETQEYIDEFVENIEHQLETVHKEQLDLLAIRAYVQTDDRGNVDLEPVRDLVNSQATEGWDHAYGHPVVLSEAVAQGFIQRFRRLLCGSVRIEPGGNTHFFVGKPFDDDFVRLERAVAAIRDGSFHLRTLRHDRLVKLRERSHNPTQFEAEFLMQLRIVLEVLETVRERVLPLLRNQASAAQQFEPLDIRISADVKRGLPLDARLAAANSSSEGRTVRAILDELVRVSYITAFMFGDPRVQHLLRREHEIQREREGLLEKATRIADRDVAERLRTHYGS